MATSFTTGKEMEGVEKMMERMNLTERKSAKLIVDDPEEAPGDLIWDVVGKVLHRRTLHVDTIVDALCPAWGNQRGLSLSSVGDNIFVANLEGKRDIARIFEGGPWMVGNQAVVLEIFHIRLRPLDLKFEMLQIWA